MEAVWLLCENVSAAETSMVTGGVGGERRGQVGAAALRPGVHQIERCSCESEKTVTAGVRVGSAHLLGSHLLAKRRTARTKGKSKKLPFLRSTTTGTIHTSRSGGPRNEKEKKLFHNH